MKTWTISDELELRELQQRKQEALAEAGTALTAAFGCIAQLSISKIKEAVRRDPTVADAMIAALKPFSSNP